MEMKKKLQKNEKRKWKGKKLIKKCKKKKRKKLEEIWKFTKNWKIQIFLEFFAFFLHFFTFFYHFACKDAKIHQKLEKTNFPRVFYIFFTWFYHFACRVLKFTKIWKNSVPCKQNVKKCKKNVKNSTKIGFFQFLVNFSILASKMIKECKKNVKKTRGKLKIHQNWKISIFLEFFTFFLHFFLHFCHHFACKDAKIHQKLEKSNFPRVFLPNFQILVNFGTLQAKCKKNVKNSRKIRFFQFLMNFGILASKMIKKSKKNVKKLEENLNFPIFGEFSIFFEFFTFFFICLSFCLQGAKIHPNLENSVPCKQNVKKM